MRLRQRRTDATPQSTKLQRCVCLVWFYLTPARVVFFCSSCVLAYGHGGVELLWFLLEFALIWLGLEVCVMLGVTGVFAPR